MPVQISRISIPCSSRRYSWSKANCILWPWTEKTISYLWIHCPAYILRLLFKEFLLFSLSPEVMEAMEIFPVSHISQPQLNPQMLSRSLLKSIICHHCPRFLWLSWKTVSMSWAGEIHIFVADVWSVIDTEKL